jgi:hypothetical protein
MRQFLIHYFSLRRFSFAPAAQVSRSSIAKFIWTFEIQAAFLRGGMSTGLMPVQFTGFKVSAAQRHS